MGKKKNKPHGHYCHICGQHKANEKFSGRGHAAHICKACHALPVAKRNELENMNKIDRIQENFFISKENLKRLKKYANDGRYPESSQYAKGALADFYNRMDEYHGNNIKTGITEPVSYAELDNDLKEEVSQRLDELIGEFLGNTDYLPEKEDIKEILDIVCEEISESLNSIYNEPESFSPSEYYGSLYSYEPEKDFDTRIQEFHELMAETEDLEDEEDEDYENDSDEDEEELEKELMIDDTLRSIFNEVLEKVLGEFKEDGFEFPTYVDTLVVVETERLKIRLFTESDFHTLYGIMKKPEVMYAWEHGFNKGETRKWLKTQYKRYKKDGYGYYAVTLKESGKLIGQVGLMKSEINGEEVVEIGYIFDNSVWGQGYCTEAAKACVELAFGKFEIKKLYCTVRPENEPSIKVAERLGMMQIGEYVKIYNNKEMPHLIFAKNNE